VVRKSGRGRAAEQAGHEAAAMNLLQDVSHGALPLSAIPRVRAGAGVCANQ
jgi:hypothetical protein